MTTVTVRCDYCGNDAHPCSGADIYPHRSDLRAKRFFRCVPCGAYVGVHENSGKPLGRLANAELRAAKMRAHAKFDPLWKRPTGTMSRSAAYKLLSERLGIKPSKCHIGMFDLEQCRKVVEVLP